MGDTDTDTISTSENLVQLIYWNGSSYNFVWNTLVKVTASEQVKIDWNAQEPIAITAGRYLTVMYVLYTIRRNI